MPLRRFLLLIAALLLAGPAGAAEEQRMNAPKARPARVELGSSAVFGPDGALYIASKRGEHVVVERSADLGQSWEAPLVVNAEPEAISADGENRPKIAFAADGGLLVSWTRPLGKPYSGAIRLARANDGRHFAPPQTVHRDPAEITHRFESLLTLADNSVIVAWIDKRDLEAAGDKAAYRGAAIYSARSTDGGRSFQPEGKLADHSCECCRIAATADRDGAPLFMWRHVYAPNERDHALARLNADGTPDSVQRATFDRWQVDGCPHHGPSLAVDAQGMRHAVWFNQKDGEGHVYYGRLVSRDGALQVDGQQTVGGPRAAHADLGTAGERLAIAWKEFDGERTQLQAMLSADGGRTFRSLPLAATNGASDQPRVIRRQDQLFAFWRTEKEGFRLIALP